MELFQIYFLYINNGIQIDSKNIYRNIPEIVCKHISNNLKPSDIVIDSYSHVGSGSLQVIYIII